ncbi:hypothetical protein ACFXPS_38585 [Nocardia sp. NPDC059091]|uniref:hypothetical protein n=1 Tax=unclassified Nocardia TaxID=2637762 RepID=UPI0036B10327
MALLGASLWVVVMLVGAGWPDQHLTGGNGQALMLKGGTPYSISANAAEGEHIACAIAPMSGSIGMDRMFTAPARKFGARTEMTTIGGFSVSESDYYSVSCRSLSGPIAPVQVAPPTPTSVLEIGGVVVILGAVAALAYGYSLTRHRQADRRDSADANSPL